MKALKKTMFCVISLSTMQIFSAYAAQRMWVPVLSTGAGVSISSDVGRSKNFPIENFTTDEFYNYSANRHAQTAALFDVSLGMEWNLCSNWLLQTGVDYNQASPFYAKGILTQGADSRSADTYTYRYHILTKQLLAQAKLLYTVAERYHPYAVIGLGAAFNQAIDYGTDVPPNLTFTRLYHSESNTAFSYAVGIGADMDVGDYMRLGIGYRFTDSGQVKLGKAMIDTSSVAGTLDQSHLYANQVLAQVTWKIM